MSPSAAAVIVPAASATPFSPRFVTETDEPSPWLDCQWAAGLMLANKASLGKYPATRAEREALRKASTDLFGGSSHQDLAKGIKARYGWVLNSKGVSFAGLLTRLNRGEGADVNGLYSRLSRHFTRWDRNFALKGNKSAHAAYVQGHDRGGNWHRDAKGNLTEVFWCDPLGRSDVATPPGDRYRGEWMPISELRAFVLGLGTLDHVLAATVAQGSAA